jgi:hypothetical protein
MPETVWLDQWAHTMAYSMKQTSAQGVVQDRYRVAIEDGDNQSG